MIITSWPLTVFPWPVVLVLLSKWDHVIPLGVLRESLKWRQGVMPFCHVAFFCYSRNSWAPLFSHDGSAAKSLRSSVSLCPEADSAPLTFRFLGSVSDTSPVCPPNTRGHLWNSLNGFFEAPFTLGPGDLRSFFSSLVEDKEMAPIPTTLS